ncbi:MAG: hypothetical protein ACOYB1_04980 [Limnohabitans sp.]
MYLGSDFHRFWARCGRHELHPDDANYLAVGSSPFNHKLLPCPFDGPLDKAKVVICLANPSDGYVDDYEQVNKLVVEMRSGEEPLPSEFDRFYQPIFRPIGIPLAELRSKVAVGATVVGRSVAINNRTDIRFLPITDITIQSRVIAVRKANSEHLHSESLLGILRGQLKKLETT